MSHVKQQNDVRFVCEKIPGWSVVAEDGGGVVSGDGRRASGAGCSGNSDMAVAIRKREADELLSGWRITCRRRGEEKGQV